MANRRHIDFSMEMHGLRSLRRGPTDPQEKLLKTLRRVAGSSKSGVLNGSITERWSDPRALQGLVNRGLVQRVAGGYAVAGSASEH